ncbi:TetR/AcrR family transcriptional regulator [Myceligenerans salitolerans]|uniref:TetR family transcriptional regulator n=1 Tax=Myceligenerans salitolerans TaxID=1230528 RepID=A0ABS3I9H2_9MICO|nr:TetR/AcrR family transcriptional regulator [Myceligenerans salitolerans]MBO0609256.1 TetR family transcriptional regulator [Myceligenerans salitolerans]
MSAQRIVTAAERVLDQGGLGALTLRRIAAEADVTPNAIYTYIPDMEALRTRIGDRFLGTIDLAPLRGPADAASLERFLHGVLERFRASPERVGILASQRVIGPHALALNEALLRFFDDAGLTEERAWSATAFLTEWVHGAAILSASETPTPRFRAELAATDLTDYPRTAAMLGGSPTTDALGLVVRALLGLDW